ncbi:hypothetical protein RUM44_003949 [Polyplax serrata]|uniref:Peptidase metallopeptidase domain-containing protein n=1 Tax=Polyplax serrata TaxID=468196 RepID=A0ABR1B1F9_POLSC
MVLLLFGLVLVPPAGLVIIEDQITQATMYLSRYGYLPPNLNEPSSAALIDKKLFSKALTDFQYFFGLNESGHLDTDTIRLMETPRCGVPDKIYGEKRRRQKRYTYMDASKPKWTNLNVTYYLFNYSVNIGTHMTKLQVDADLKTSLEFWSNASALTFTKLPSPEADIMIGWAYGDHGDNYPFDGPGKTLAHAFSPCPGIGGDTHFDEAETWTTGVDKGVNLIQAATHEFGHALGLGHSAVSKAVMAPTYNGFSESFALHQDDIDGIQSLYGGPTDTARTKVQTNAPEPTKKIDTRHHVNIPETRQKEPHRVPTHNGTVKVNSLNPLCYYYTKINTMFTDAHHRTYVFVAAFFWELTTSGISWGYPKLISRNWHGAPSNLDAALNYNGLTYFFKDFHVWCYSGTSLIQGYPKQIQEAFNGIPSHIDAAVPIGDTKNLINNICQSMIILNQYHNGKGVPNNITAAFKMGVYTYIILKTGYYYRISHVSGGVVHVSKQPPYPRNFLLWWLNCPYVPQRRHHHL